MRTWNCCKRVARRMASELGQAYDAVELLKALETLYVLHRKQIVRIWRLAGGEFFQIAHAGPMIWDRISASLAPFPGMTSLCRSALRQTTFANTGPDGRRESL